MRRFQHLPDVSAASRFVVPSALAATSLLHHAVLRAHHHAATHLGLTPARLDTELQRVVVEPASAADASSSSAEAPPLPPSLSSSSTAAAHHHPLLPEGLQQDWIRESFSPTQSLVRFVPTNGTFVVGPDDVLRYHPPGGEGDDALLLDLPCCTLTVQYDRRQYPPPPATTTTMMATMATHAHDPWVVKLFNVGLLVGAVELLIAVDTYRDDRMQSQEPSFPAFARFDASVLVALLLGPRTLAALPVPLVPNYQAQVGATIYAIIIMP
jgi:hypothetical protein